MWLVCQLMFCFLNLGKHVDIEQAWTSFPFKCPRAVSPIDSLCMSPPPPPMWLSIPPIAMYITQLGRHDARSPSGGPPPHRLCTRARTVFGNKYMWTLHSTHALNNTALVTRTWNKWCHKPLVLNGVPQFPWSKGQNRDISHNCIIKFSSFLLEWMRRVKRSMWKDLVG